MNIPTIAGQTLKLTAAAVVFALGSSAATAQQGGAEQRPDREQSQQGAQQSQQDRQQTPQQGSQQSQQDRQQTAQQDSQQSQQDSRQSEQDRPQGDESAAEQSESDRTQVAAAGQGAGQSDPGQIDQLAEQNDDLSTFVEAVKAAGMAESLTDGTSYTLFAPTNDAFEQMSGMDTEELMQPQNREQLVGLLRAHIVADDVDRQTASSLQEAQTIDGGSIEISESDGELSVGDAQVEGEDIQLGSLRIYTIDQVLSEGRTQSAAAPEDEEESSELR